MNDIIIIIIAIISIHCPIMMFINRICNYMYTVDYLLVGQGGLFLAACIVTCLL